MTKLWTVEDLAEFLGISKNRVYDLVAAGVIPAVRVGKLLRFHPDVIQELSRKGGFGFDKPRHGRAVIATRPATKTWGSSSTSAGSPGGKGKNHRAFRIMKES